MRKRFLEGIAGIGLLAVLPACNVSKQATTEDIYSTAREIEGGTEAVEPATAQVFNGITRSVEIPQLQIDAQSVYQRMITYIVPDEELAPKILSKRISAYIDYPAGGESVNPKYGNNRAELAKLEERLLQLLQGDNGDVKNIRITGYASPDGNTKENERLAGNRAIQFKNYLQKKFNLPNNGLITIDWAGEDWDGLQRLIAGSNKVYSSRVQAIFQLTDDPDSRRKQIKTMDNGAVYKDIEKSFFGRLRRMELAVETESPLLAAADPQLIEQVYTQPDKVSLSDFIRVASFYRPGTEQYREVYEIADYTYPSCAVVQLNAAAAALALGDRESARYFFQQVDNDPRAYNNLGVLSLMDGDKETAASYFRKSLPQNPRQARENLRVLSE